MIHLISYDLNKKGQNYDALYEQIKTASDYCHMMESVWLISTSYNVEYWSDKLRKVMDNNDLLFVVDITEQKRNGWLRGDVLRWITKNDR